MNSEQIIPALLAAFMRDPIIPSDARCVERVVDFVLDLKLGESIDGDSPMLRAFVNEQARRLEHS